jgi:hypothetical protein
VRTKRAISSSESGPRKWAFASDAGREDQGVRSFGILEEREVMTHEASDLTMIEEQQDLIGRRRINSIRNASTERFVVGSNQRRDSTRCLWNTTMIGRALPKAPLPSADESATTLEKIKRRPENEGAVAEDPHAESPGTSLRITLIERD